jgi:hypothetical protein
LGFSGTTAHDHRIVLMVEHRTEMVASTALANRWLERTRDQMTAVEKGTWFGHECLPIHPSVK